MANSAAYSVGIDLGTTNSAIAYVDLTSEEPSPIEVMPVPQLINPGEVAALSLLPSFLYVAGAFDFPADSLALPWHDDDTATRPASRPDHGPSVIRRGSPRADTSRGGGGGARARDVARGAAGGALCVDRQRWRSLASPPPCWRSAARGGHRRRHDRFQLDSGQRARRRSRARARRDWRSHPARPG